MSSPGFCADGGSFPAACTCIPGLARGVERAQRTDLEVKNLTNDGISSHFRLAAVVQSPARSPRHPQTRGPLTFRLERAFHTCLCRFPIKNSAASAAPPSRTTNHEPRTTNHESRNLDTDNTGACRDEADSRIPNLSQTNLSDKRHQ